MTRIPTSTSAAGELGPIGGDESTVLELVRWIHQEKCAGMFAEAHDPMCNTMRLLADDQAHLAAESRRVGLVAARVLAEKHNAIEAQR